MGTGDGHWRFPGDFVEFVSQVANVDVVYHLEVGIVEAYLRDGIRHFSFTGEAQDVDFCFLEWTGWDDDSCVV